MAYQLTEVTIRTNNSQEGMQKIDALWKDIGSGKLPVLFDSEGGFLKGISPVSRYSRYESDEKGDYDLSVLGVQADFFREMEQKVGDGQYRKYDEVGGDLAACAQKAWQRVWDEQAAGIIRRSFTEDFESTVPGEYTKDGEAHCYLYIAVERNILS